MTDEFIGLAGFVALTVLVVLGVPVGFALFATGIVGLTLVGNWNTAFAFLTSVPYNTSATYGFAVVPMFLLMANLLGGAGFARDAYNSAAKWVGHLPAGLAIATTGGAALFGAVCGSSMASTALFTKTALPQMIEYRYDKGMAAGSIAAAGTLAMMIPPSLVMIVFAILTEQGIAQLLIAGLLPGILLAVLFSIYMYVRVRITPSLAPLTPKGVSFREKVRSLRGVWPIPVLFVVVIGGIYLGWFTPSAAAAIGAAVAVVLVLVRGEFTRSELLEALKETGVTTSSIFLLVIGGLVFTRFVSLSGTIHTITAFVGALNVPPLAILLLILMLYLVLGCFLESVSMMVVSLPVVFPLIVAQGYDPIWFGVMVVLMAEIGMLTPPLGLNVYMVHSVAGGTITMREAFVGIIPFVFVSLVAAAILIAFPQIALLLPYSMN
jgi:C4-dicarboxylate transporter, DctM subunit